MGLWDELKQLGAAVIKEVSKNMSSDDDYESGDYSQYDSDVNYDDDDNDEVMEEEYNKYDKYVQSFSNSVEKKSEELKKKARDKYKQQARNASDSALRNALNHAQETDNQIMQEVIEEEMERRGIY